MLLVEQATQQNRVGSPVMCLTQHIQRVFPRHATDILSKLDSETANIPGVFLTLREITITTILKLKAQKVDYAVIGRLGYSSKRGGNLVLEDETSSIPIALKAWDRDPRLLNAIVRIQNFDPIFLIDWDERILVNEYEWLNVDKNGEANSKRFKESEAANNSCLPATKFYLELTVKPSILIPSQFLDHSQQVDDCSPSSILGRIAAISPLILDAQTKSRYWLIDLTNGTIISVIDARNEGLRALLRIGQTYEFKCLRRVSLAFRGNHIDADMLDEEHGSISWINDDHNEISIEDVTSINGSLSQFDQDNGVNLVSYEGIVTGRPAGHVVELDSKYKVILGRTPKSMWLGLRKGARVIFRNISQVFYRGKIVGFESTFRTDFEIVEFAQGAREPQIRFPPLKEPFARLSPLAFYHGMDYLSRRLLFAPLTVQNSQTEIFMEGIREADELGACAQLSGDVKHPIALFLFDWEVPLRTFNVNLPVLMSLEETIWLAISNGKDETKFNMNENGYLVGSIGTSPLTGQLSLFNSNQCVEIVLGTKCSFNESLELDEILGATIKICEFNVVLERMSIGTYAALPNRENIQTSLDSTFPRMSKGSSLFHGHVSLEDGASLTRVFLSIERMELIDTSACKRIEDVYVQPASVSYEFQRDAQTMFTALVMEEDKDTREVRSVMIDKFDDRFTLSRTLRNRMNLTSIEGLLKTKSMPSVLYFVITSSAAVVPARNYDLTFQEQRMLHAKRSGIKVTSVLSDCALKIVCRDLQSPLCVDLFLSLEMRVLPSQLFVVDPKRVWALTGAVLAGNDNKAYIQADAKASLVSMLEDARSPKDLAWTFPQNLARLPMGSLAELRRSNVSAGMCVRASSLYVLWARYSYEKCECGGNSNNINNNRSQLQQQRQQSCSCPLMDDRLRLMVLVEADDGTDNCQLFADGENAFVLLDIAKGRLREFCGYSARALRKIEYRLNAECEPTSPQGLFRRFLLNGEKASIPRRMFVVKDRPMKPKEEKKFNPSTNAKNGISFQHTDEDLEEEAIDRAKFAYTKNWNDAKVKTRLVDKLSVKLIEIERVVDFKDDLQ